MTNLRRVSVFGGREITQDIYDETVILGNMLAKEGYTIFCGGGRGVMEAISKGAEKRNGLGHFSFLHLLILPPLHPCLHHRR